MRERFSPGDLVRTTLADPPHHTRAPRYVRGAAGTVLEAQGPHPLPDDRARGSRASRRTSTRCGSPPASCSVRETGTALPEDVDVTVWDASAESRYMVLPRRPEGTDALDEAALATLVTRNGLLGVAAV